MAYTIPSWTKLVEDWRKQQLQINSDHTVNDIKDLDRYGDVKFIDSYIDHLNSLDVDYDDNHKADCLAGVMLTIRQRIGDEYQHLNPKGSLLNKGSSVYRALDTILNPADKTNPMDPITAYRVYEAAFSSYSKVIYVDGDVLKGKKLDHKLVIRDDREGKKGEIFDHTTFCSTLKRLTADAWSKKDNLDNEANKKTVEAERKAKLEEEKRIRQEAEKAKGHASGGVFSTLKHMVWSSTPAPTSTTDEKFTPAEPQGPS